MTQQEQQLLDGLIQRVNSTQLATKDPDAERFLINALGPNPDALYILCQTVLVQQFAMENSQHELATLRTQLQQLQQQAPARSEEHGSFLGNLFGLSKSPAPPPQPPASAPTGYQPVHDPGPQYPPQAYPPQAYPPQSYPPYPAQPGYPPPPGYGYGAQPMGMGGGLFGGGGGGFLAGAAQTAAGVVAGEMAFRALEDVFGGHHGYGSGFDGPREIVNNNYYDDNTASGGSGFGDRLGAADGLDNSGISPDIEDRRGQSSGFFGSDSNDDSANFADNTSDDSGSFDDSSSYDDNSGGGDDSGF
jgi:hypothetical protein